MNPPFHPHFNEQESNVHIGEHRTLLIGKVGPPIIGDVGHLMDIITSKAYMRVLMSRL